MPLSLFDLNNYFNNRYFILLPKRLQRIRPQRSTFLTDVVKVEEFT